MAYCPKCSAYVSKEGMYCSMCAGPKRWLGETCSVEMIEIHQPKELVDCVRCNKSGWISSKEYLVSQLSMLLVLYATGEAKSECSSRNKSAAKHEVVEDKRAIADYVGDAMNQNTAEAIKAILRSDQTVSAQDLSCILAVCRNPQIAAQSTPGSARGTRQFLTPKQAAQALSTSLRTVWRLAERGEIRRVKLGTKTTRFILDDIEGLADP
jgi:excisionase family DNA binding protein